MGNIRHNLGAITMCMVLIYTACHLIGCGSDGGDGGIRGSGNNVTSPSQDTSGYLKVADVLKWGELKTPAEAGIAASSPYIMKNVYKFSSHDCPANSHMSSILTPDLYNIGVGFNKTSGDFFAYDIAGKYRPELNSDETVMTLTFRTVDKDGNVVSEQCSNTPYKSSDDPNILNLECEFSAIDSYERPYFEETCQLEFKYSEYSYFKTTGELVDLSVAKEPVFIPYFFSSVVNVMAEDPSVQNVFWLNLDEYANSSFSGEKLVRWDTKGTLNPDDDVTNDYTSSLAPSADNESNVTAILTEPNGGIWFATDGNGVSHKDGSNRWSNYTITLDGWEYDVFYSSVLRTDGTPCFGAELGTIFCFSGGEWTSIDTPAWGHISALVVSPLNEIYAGNSYGDVFYIDSSNAVTELSAEGRSFTGSILAIELHDDILYAGTTYDGLYIYDTADWQLIDHFTHDDAARRIGGDEIGTILIDDSTVWFGMNRFGLGYLDSNMGYHDYSRYGAGLVDNSIADIIKDRTGRIWFAGNGVRLVSER